MSADEKCDQGETLECPVCWELYSYTDETHFPVISCSDGRHSVCKTDFLAMREEKTDTCPICRRLFPEQIEYQTEILKFLARLNQDSVDKLKAIKESNQMSPLYIARFSEYYSAPNDGHTKFCVKPDCPGEESCSYQHFISSDGKLHVCGCSSADCKGLLNCPTTFPAAFKSCGLGACGYGLKCLSLQDCKFQEKCRRGAGCKFRHNGKPSSCKFDHYDEQVFCTIGPKCRESCGKIHVKCPHGFVRGTDTECKYHSLYFILSGRMKKCKHDDCVFQSGLNLCDQDDPGHTHHTRAHRVKCTGHRH
eukprot:TRINITY_DN1400_c0_g1_i1.p1 TRINITY_DN1400_c0_g1~~TRINITY_DN1400_c0_g1_i1.p1  ORF type:complete len:306 (-),score=43.53 TRINITY_DN1400_c0_g1_i1:67-984(-)